MATQEVLLKTATQIAFYVTASYVPVDVATGHKIGSPTEVVLTQASLANGAGRQSAKVTLPAAWAPEYALFASVDFTGETPTAGNGVDYLWLPSTSTTLGTGNIAGNSGADGAAPDGALGSITLAEFILLAIPIGSLVVHDGAVVQNGYIGSFRPPTQFGQILVVNNSGDAFEADDVEMGVFMNPVIDDIQAAA